MNPTIESKIPNNTFCPDKIFIKFDTYITQVQILDNIQVSNQRKISTRTLGLVSISEKVGLKKIEIIKDGITLYSAEKKQTWEICDNQLNSQQIHAIDNLPQNKEEIFHEFYSRKLTLMLKKVFQHKNYPVNHKISINHAQIPYKFFISDESSKNKIVFIGNNLNKNIVFKSSIAQDLSIEIEINNLPLEHINNLCCLNI
ncbi:MAG: hypothetical protein AAFO95_16960 [Cyanobacteria bacterium J06600_6]